MLGIKSGKVELRNYKDEYQMIAKETINELEGLIGDKVVQIEHVGSTSIIGIKSKPIIDIAVGVDSFDAIDKIKKSLEQNGYFYSKVKLNNTVVDFIYEENGVKTKLIHFCIFNGERWKEFVLFRDYLNKHFEIAKNYEYLKLKLAKENENDIHKYTEGKSEFVSMVLKKAEEKLK